MNKPLILALLLGVLSAAWALKLPSAAFNQGSAVKFTYQVSLLSGEVFTCDKKDFYKKGAKEGAIVLNSCSNGQTFFLDKYILDNSCFEDCPSEELSQKDCFTTCAAQAKQDLKNITLNITEISSL